MTRQTILRRAGAAALGVGTALVDPRQLAGLERRDRRAPRRAGEERQLAKNLARAQDVEGEASTRFGGPHDLELPSEDQVHRLARITLGKHGVSGVKSPDLGTLGELTALRGIHDR